MGPTYSSKGSTYYYPKQKTTDSQTKKKKDESQTPHLHRGNQTCHFRSPEGVHSLQGTKIQEPTPPPPHVFIKFT
jgi:hypothetical protein